MSAPLALLLQRAELSSREPVVLGLQRVLALLARLGNPQEGLRVLHVAGTNGKGSVCAFLASLLKGSGFSVGVYTSPHLERFNERIQLNDGPIADEVLAPLLEEVLSVNDERHATYFELTTAAAFLHFARERPDWVVLETGLGGRLDATNVVIPALSLITPIAMDHAGYLGGDIPTIAAEKAGIIKAGVPVVADPGPAALGVIAARAQSLQAPLLVAGRDFTWQRQAAGGWRFADRHGACELPAPSLAGGHQYGNAALALAGLRHLAWGAHPMVLRHDGIERARNPGRLESFQQGGVEVLLDGAHNPHAVLALVEALAELPPKPTNLLLGVMASKEVTRMVPPLLGVAQRVWTTTVGEGHAACDPGLLAALFSEAGVPVQGMADPLSAFAAALAATRAGERLLVAGSLYLVGTVRAKCLGT